jgi:hypothetical protein
VPSASDAEALSPMAAGAVNVAPAAGLVNPTAGAWFGGGGGGGVPTGVTDTLSNVTVARRVASWLETASPT